jgi:hypothetical protein
MPTPLKAASIHGQWFNKNSDEFSTKAIASPRPMFNELLTSGDAAINGKHTIYRRLTANPL